MRGLLVLLPCGLLLFSGCPSTEDSQPDQGAAQGTAATAEQPGISEQTAQEPGEGQTASGPDEGQAATRQEHAGFTFGPVHLGMTIDEVRDYIATRSSKVAFDTTVSDPGGEILLFSDEYFDFEQGILSAYSPPSITGMSETEFDELALGFTDENPGAKHGTDELPAGYSVPEGDVADAARLEYWFNEQAQELLVAGWRAADGYYWLWLTGREP